jgi:hypothetical protein
VIGVVIFQNKTLNVKISDKITKPLGTLITGDTKIAPYLSASQLVHFYNECGFFYSHEAGFPSRWQYSTDKIVESNGTPRLKKILEAFVDPRRYSGDEEIVEKIVVAINKLIKYDGFELRKIGEFYKITDLHVNSIEPEVLKQIGQEFVIEQIEKCKGKIATNDFNGAITNARTLCEAVFIHTIEQIEKTEIKNDGDLLDLWKRVKKALKLDQRKDKITDFEFQILTGLTTTINGVAALSNNASDRHANTFETKRHHAKLAVNTAITLCEFLIDILKEQEK